MDTSAVTLQKDPTKHKTRSLPSNKLRWVDFDNGDDSNDGLTKATAWKTLHGHLHGNSGYGPIDGHYGWNGTPERLDEYFHGGQIGPGYEYRLRGTCYDQAMFIQSDSWPTPSTYALSFAGTKQHPIIFTSWDIVHDRAVLRGNNVIETTNSNPTYAPGHWAPDDHWAKWIGIDFVFHGENSVMYGNHYSFIDCTFSPDPAYPENGVSLLIYGDWCFFDRCHFQSANYYPLLLYGVYTVIQNCVFEGFNQRGGQLDRTSESESEYDKRGQMWIMLVYMQDSPPPYHQSDALRIINNTFVGWSSPDDTTYGIFLIYDDFGFSGNHTGVIIRNNIFADIPTRELEEGSSDEENRSLWYIEPTLAPIVVDHNLFADDMQYFSGPEFYRNGYETYTDDDEVITFDPDTDKVLVDPKFVNKHRGNFRLRGSSPAINAGSTNLAPKRDHRNTVRDTHPDIGAFEHHKSKREGT